MSGRFTQEAMNLFHKIEKMTLNNVTENDTKKIAASLIEVMEGHNLTYDQAQRILEITSDTLRVKALALRL